MTALHRIVAITLIVLAASPVTAPFTTCSALDLLQPLTGRRPSVAQAFVVARESSSLRTVRATVDPTPDPPVELRSQAEASHLTASVLVVSYVSDFAASPLVSSSPLPEPGHRPQRLFQSVTALRV